MKRKEGRTLPAGLLLVSLLGCRETGNDGMHYRVAQLASSLDPLLEKNDAVWQRAQRIVWGPAPYATAFRALWNDAGLFARFDVTDPDPWHISTAHDDKLWNEEVVEIFLQPGGQEEYGELEISPANVVTDVWVNPNARRFDASWNLEGLVTRVAMRADDVGRPAGWTALAVMPWSSFAAAKGVGPPPRAGDRWRFNVFRIERPAGKERPEQDAQYLAWSPTGQRTFHVAEAFRDLVFVDP
jgi:hypothetical protein